MEIKNNDLSGAIETIAKMARESRQVERLTLDGREYLLSTDGNGNTYYKEIIKSDTTAYPECMRVNTLDAFINYVLSGIDNGEITDKLYINVTSPTRVVAQTPVNAYGRRKTIAEAARYNLRSFTFGQYNSFEGFVVSLQSQFVCTEERGQLLDSLKQMTQSNEVHTEENGISQTVVAKAGATLGSIQVSPIWRLSPFRTFTEIVQPDSLFLLRLKQSGESAEFALHETDGGVWAVTAMQEIKEYLSGRLLTTNTVEKIFIL